MSRKHKYRGLTEKGKEVKGYYVLIEGQAFIVHQDSCYTWQEDAYRIQGMIEVDPSTVGEFTGFLDKNGKDCYENDMMQLTHTCEDDCCLTRIVMNEKGQWSLEYEGRIICSLWDGIYQHNGEVIGHVHQEGEQT